MIFLFISGQSRPWPFSSWQTACINTANEFWVFPLPLHTLSSSPIRIRRARTDSQSNEGPHIHRTTPWRTLRQNLSVAILSLINLQVVSCRLSEMIIVTAWRACPSLACLTSLTPPEQAARLNDKVVSAKPSWFRASRKIDTYFSLLRCSLKCDIINCSSSLFFSPPCSSFRDLRL